MRRVRSSWCSVGVIALLLSGCEAQVDDLEQQVRKARAARAESAQSLPVLPTLAISTPSIARDPFDGTLAEDGAERWRVVRRAN